jgi:hypothetical protein
VDFTPPFGPTGIVTIPQNSLYPTAFHNNLLFAEVNGGTLRRIVLAGAQLDHLGSISVAFKGGKGGVTGYHTRTGRISVRFWLQRNLSSASQSVSAPRLSPAIHVRARILQVNPVDDQLRFAVVGDSIESGPIMGQKRLGGLSILLAEFLDAYTGTRYVSSSIVYNGGNGFLLSLMVGPDGFVYVSNETTIFKVVVTP